ncbi:Small-conductance mechanosensitive channel [Pararobbsia alpina]|uniref:mechanosensitive ion channel domain-containing protein n=1 Tax=Pararobbsia alpina TaxID=621374 RepID=UPI0039A58F9A
MSHLAYSIVAAAAVIAFDVAAWRAIDRQFARLRLVVRSGAFVGLTWVMLRAGMSPFSPAPQPDERIVHFLAQCVELIWWLQLAKVASALLDRNVLPQIWNRERLFRDVLSAVVFIAAGVSALGYVLDTPVRGLIVTSGAVAVILGLAVQSTLSDVFSGIVLNSTEPFKIGDWIFIGEIEGEVVECNWRATSLLNPQGNIVVIPNSAAAKTNIINHSQPPRMHGVSVILHISPDEPAATVVEALTEAAASSMLVQTFPEPVVKALHATVDSIEYEVIAFVDDLAKKNAARNELFDLAQRHLSSAGIFMRPLRVPGAVMMSADSRLRLLRRVDMFRTLDEMQLVHLSDRLTMHDFQPGQTIREAKPRDGERERLLIIARGIASLKTLRGEHEIELRRMSPGDSLGQSAILAGARVEGILTAQTPVTICCLEQDALTPILQARPEIARRMCRILAEEMASDQSLLSASSGKPDRDESFFDWLNDGIHRLHHLVLSED